MNDINQKEARAIKEQEKAKIEEMDLMGNKHSQWLKDVTTNSGKTASETPEIDETSTKLEGKRSKFSSMSYINEKEAKAVEEQEKAKIEDMDLMGNKPNKQLHMMLIPKEPYGSPEENHSVQVDLKRTNS